MTDMLLREIATQAPNPEPPRAFGRAHPTKAKAQAPQSQWQLRRANWLRLSILALALGSGYGALQLIDTPHPTQQSQAMPVSAPLPETEDVLITQTDLPLGHVLTANDMIWMAWPKSLVSDQAIRRSHMPQAREDMAGAILRASFIKGEPMRTEKITFGKSAGVLAAILPAGARAMAISIDAQGATTAGGFILPNDRVDVIRTIVRPDPAGKNEGVIQSETAISNLRVLAIGQNIQEKNGERVITGTTATLEVDPQQAEILAQAQRSGQISLALRSLKDATPSATPLKRSQAHVSVMHGTQQKDYAVRETRP